VPTIVVSPSTVPGTKSGTHFTHYSMPRTTSSAGRSARLACSRTASGLVAW
jgi:hypothetical protein